MSRRPRREPARATEVELTIDRLAAGGDGVGRDADGRVTFVPGSGPGERVIARVMEEHRSFARAELAEIVAPSPARVQPRCPLFVARTCGGCVWQHLDHPAQAAGKEGIARGALRRLVDGGLVIHPIATPVPAYGWRRRTRMHWLRLPRMERAVIGFFAPASRRLTEVTACPQLEPALEAALPAIHAALGPALHGRGELELLLGDGGAIHVALAGRCDPSAAAALVGQAGVVGVSQPGGEHGAARVALDRELDGRADRFAQASAAGNAALVAAVAAACGAPGRALELHAGSGNFTRALALGAGEVVAVERIPGPTFDGPRVSWRVGAAERVLEAILRKGERFDLVLLDPPRTGARELMAPIARLGAATVVYVSCDPATLARDLELLVAAGYQARDAWPFDLMPQTAHLEVVVRLERAHGERESVGSA